MTFRLANSTGNFVHFNLSEHEISRLIQAKQLKKIFFFVLNSQKLKNAKMQLINIYEQDKFHAQLNSAGKVLLLRCQIKESPVQLRVNVSLFTPGRRQSKTLSTIDERGS